MVSKSALTATGLKAKATCGSKQLCAGLEAEIEGAVHVVMKQPTADRDMQFFEEKVDSEAPEPPVAAAYGGEAEGPNVECGTMEEWARLFTQSG